ncbi:ASCH domain-containing protein [Phyllobacterium myrsinacearum]|uniref:ASCH domain-containing protein n=1 Tax=Phyllobacterium myrsinacearum TaxID=28101 RepID=A0A839EZ95_9HYPH|nr:ASCH domain-containing protein [Phyllobacterium myrsinacearum]MBA8881780.1 hypothetical protein [Phyllobacterium myrsinacearum]
MKVISVWQPWASLIVHGMKFFETRTWSAPKSIIGQTIGIAATKNITPDQRSAYADPEFQRFYEQCGLPPLEELPRAVLLGTVLLDSVELITEDFLEEITDEEKAFGWHQLGGYAWRLRYARQLPHPIPIQGKQGIYDWKGFDKLQPVLEKPEDVRAYLQVV